MSPLSHPLTYFEVLQGVRFIGSKRENDYDIGKLYYQYYPLKISIFKWVMCLVNFPAGASINGYDVILRGAMGKNSAEDI